MYLKRLHFIQGIYLVVDRDGEPPDTGSPQNSLSKAGKADSEDGAS